MPFHTHPSHHTHALLTMSSSNDKIIHYYRETEPSHSLLPSVKEALKSVGLVSDADLIESVKTESCFNVQLTTTDLSKQQTEQLEWLLAETFDRDGLRLEQSALVEQGIQMEFGPRMTFTSAFSSNAVGICSACHLPVKRLERSKRFLFLVSTAMSDKAVAVIKDMLHDRMTEQEYEKPLETFDSGAHREPVVTVPIMSEGRAALEKINAERGLGFDDFDLDYYTNLFKVNNDNVYYFGRVSCLYVVHVSASIHLGKTRSRSDRRGVL